MPTRGATLAPSAHDHHFVFPGLRAIVRHAAPNLLIATLVPTALFYLGWYTQGRSAAFALALGWALTVVAWRAVRRQRIPALLVLTTALLVIRTVVGFMSGSTTFYFFQPVVTATLIGAMFIISVAAGRPLISKLAGDFCPLPAAVTERAEVRRHFRNLSYLWAAVYFANAVVTLLLLLNLPVATFVATKTFTGLTIEWTGAAITAIWSLRVARQTGLMQPKQPELGSTLVPVAA
jgi:intracellular septation protein A